MKKALTFLLLAALLTAPLTGCDRTDNGDEPTKTTTPSGDKDTDNIPPYNAADANPASDFEYEVGEDGGITITKYIGTDTDVVIPEKINGKNVTVIGSYAFSRNTIIVSVSMPDTVILLEGGAFLNCPSLTTVRLSQTLQTIYSGVFENCPALSTIALPGTLTQIRARAFANCTSLKHIRIPKSVTDWRDQVFAESGLETVELENGLTVLGESAFIGTQIRTIEIPGSVKIIPYGILGRCMNLETVILNDGLEGINYMAFSNATELTEIVIPKTVTSCTELAFVGCNALKEVKFEGNAPSDFENQDQTFEEMYESKLPTFTVYYHEGATGFTTPEWNGYKTEIW